MCRQLYCILSGKLVFAIFALCFILIFSLSDFYGHASLIHINARYSACLVFAVFVIMLYFTSTQSNNTYVDLEVSAGQEKTVDDV